MGAGAAVFLATGHDIMSAFVLQSSVWRSGRGPPGWRSAMLGQLEHAYMSKVPFHAAVLSNY